MNQDLEQETELKRYLLGELTLEEQVLIEQRLFLDRDYAQLAQAVEDDLIDDYVRDDLSAIERKKFETHFLLQRPEHNEDLRIAQALERYLDFEFISHPAADQFVLIGKNQPPGIAEAGAPVNTTHKDESPVILQTRPKRRPVVWFALAATVFIILSVITWIAIRSVRKPGNEPIQAGKPQPIPTEPVPQQQPGPSSPNNDNSVETVDRRHEGPNKKPNEREVQPPEQRRAQTTFPAVTILPGGTSRGEGQTNQVVIKSEQRDVILKLPLTTTKDYQRYHLELLSGQRRVRSQILSSQIDEELRRPVIFISLPARVLTQRRYEIKLRGITADRHQDQLEPYSFTVRKEK